MQLGFVSPQHSNHVFSLLVVVVGFRCKVLALVADHLREDEMTSQAATWNNPAMNAAWALMSLPLMFRTCPFLIIAIAS